MTFKYPESHSDSSLGGICTVSPQCSQPPTGTHEDLNANGPRHPYDAYFTD